MTAPVPPFDGTQVCAQVDPELFFPDKGDGNRVAKALCLSCHLRVACLEYGLAIERTASGRWGIWGGTSAMERRRIAERSTRVEHVRPVAA